MKPVIKVVRRYNEIKKIQIMQKMKDSKVEQNRAECDLPNQNFGGIGAAPQTLESPFGQNLQPTARFSRF